jgi:hypothetical protein
MEKNGRISILFLKGLDLCRKMMIDSVKKGKIETINSRVGSSHRKPAFEGKVRQIESKGHRERKMAPMCIFVNVDKDLFFLLTKMCGGQSLSSFNKEMVECRGKGPRH